MTGDERRLVLFPGAGSFGSEFHALRSAAGPSSKVMRYPGRSGRDAGEAVSFEAVVASCADQIAGLPGARPVLLGHSYGAYLAYATALALARRPVPVSLLVVAGASAPDLLRVPPEATASAEAAAAYLDTADPGQLAAAAPEWREAVAETAQRDLRVLAELSLADPPARLSCPVLALRGARDPLTSDASVAEWQRFTQGDFGRRTFEGGHSDLLGDPLLAGLVHDELVRGTGAVPPDSHRTAGPAPR
ncbi:MULTISPECIES: alpha/beta fold hydrolase [unclassified Streptomyces]|uniref:thioesterase II family protein n=1 Tax=unclassified Streptomyces TaxID=2593676 RepID=UPI00344EB28A